MGKPKFRGTVFGECRTTTVLGPKKRFPVEKTEEDGTVSRRFITVQAKDQKAAWIWVGDDWITRSEFEQRYGTIRTQTSREEFLRKKRDAHRRGVRFK